MRELFVAGALCVPTYQPLSVKSYVHLSPATNNLSLHENVVYNKLLVEREREAWVEAYQVLYFMLIELEVGVRSFKQVS